MLVVVAAAVVAVDDDGGASPRKGVMAVELWQEFHLRFESLVQYGGEYYR